MPTFVKVRQGVMDYGYLLRIQDSSTLLDYFERSASNRFARGAYDCMQSKEFGKLVGVEGGSHCRTALGHSLMQLCHGESLCNNGRGRGRGILDVMMTMQDRVFQAMLTSLQRVGTIYVNCNGGFFHHTEQVEVLEEQEQETFTFPTDNARITRWPNGTHWYARIGDIDVRDSVGNMKWNTRKEAEMAVEWFRKSKEK